MIAFLKDKVLAGQAITKAEASHLSAVAHADIDELFSAANRIRKALKGDSTELCAIVNAKSGACPEDCAYCAQSSRSKTDAPVYGLLDKDRILEKAREARDGGVTRFSIVTSGRKPDRGELARIASTLGQMRNLGLKPCASLGLLKEDELSYLKEHGLDRYHHNLETSANFFPAICRTHTYAEKVNTIEAARAAGLSVCSGGIFGMGESWQDRIDMAFALRETCADSVPVNFLIPIKGTPLGNREPLTPLEALKIVSLYRFVLPEKEIRICGGRTQVLGELHSMTFIAGADSVMTGNYLTTTGRSYADDLKLIRQHGLRLT